METLRDLRMKAGLGQKEVSRQIGVSIGAYSAYENGWKTPRLPKMVKLSQVLMVDVTKLVKIFLQSELTRGTESDNNNVAGGKQ